MYMNRIVTSSVIVMLLVSNIVFAQSAVEHMNAMSTEFKAIQSSTWDYTKSAANNKSARKTNKRRLELIQQIETSIKNVNKIPAFEKQRFLKDSVLSYLKMQKIVITEDYSKIMDLEDIAESSYDAMEAYLKAREIANDKLEESSKKVDEAYNRFAKDNNVTIREGGNEDKITQRLKIADEVYTYYNEVYLIFFKAYKQEAYLLDALNKGDISALEQNKVSLSNVSAECQNKLKSVHAFRNTDNSIRTAASELLSFYKNEADISFVKLIDFQAKKEAFDKSKKAFESSTNKSNDDINNYNKLIGDLNKSSADFNATNADLNKKRSALLNNWNNSTQSFTAKYL